MNTQNQEQPMFDPNDDSQWTSISEGAWTPDTQNQAPKPNQIPENRKHMRHSSKKEAKNRPLFVRALLALLKCAVFMAVVIFLIILVNLVMEAGSFDIEYILGGFADILSGISI